MTMTIDDIAELKTIWVYEAKGRYGVLFEGNANQGVPPYSLGCLLDVLDGRKLIWGYTRYDLTIQHGDAARKWNAHWAKSKVKPCRVCVAWAYMKKGGR